MKFHPTTLKDAVLIELERRGDDRGFFARTFCADEFAANGLPTEFVQQNMSYSATKGTIRGMHFQRAPHAEDKLIRCLRGAIVDIILDLRPDSPTYKRWEAFELNEENKRQLLVPKGFAHGFQTVSDHVEVTYLVSSRYNGAAEGGVRWNDPAFGITWPLAPTEMSDKDKKWADFAD
ncbi:dTDP-4-dehydrorhamnose 3,5-epimerase [Hyphomonas sp.]|uniref:dTDP-4-dehydrorhamnose 3,5-epimerase n=1 Tax=Hyphomonas sp. TaxID=87 RepID=UPI000A4B596F|nr:dTDP-4-dehydrorhamnose 3,5-epimerase [Hyphomonas sp.]